MCEFFTISRSFHPSTIQHTQYSSVRADSSSRRETSPRGSQNHDKEILHCNAVSRVDKAMTCHSTRYDRYDVQMLLACRKTDALTREKNEKQIEETNVLKKKKKKTCRAPHGGRDRKNATRPRAKGKDRKTEAQQKAPSRKPQQFVVRVA